MDFKYAIFDMDGTLIDSMPTWRKVELEIIENKSGIKFDKEDVKNLYTQTLWQMAQYANKKYNAKLSNADIRDMGLESYDYMENYYIKGEIALKPYVREYLTYLKDNNVKIAIATATTKRLTIPYLKKVGIFEYIDAIATTSDDVKVGKSAGPDVYDLALNWIGGTKNEAVIFEDVLIAVNTAKNAGYYTVAIYDEVQGESRENIIKTADKFINTFKEMMV